MGASYLSRKHKLWHLWRSTVYIELQCKMVGASYLSRKHQLRHHWRSTVYIELQYKMVGASYLSRKHQLWHHWRSIVYIELHLPQYATVRMIHCKVRISGREPCKIWCTFAVQKLQLLCLLQMIYKNFLFSWKLSFALHIKSSF